MSPRPVPSQPGRPAGDATNVRNRQTNTCAHPWCSKPITVPATGRTPKYCGEAHRKHAHRLRQQAERIVVARLAALERAKAEREERIRLAAELVSTIQLAPAKSAELMVIWMERRPGREHELWSLATFFKTNQASRAR